MKPAPPNLATPTYRPFGALRLGLALLVVAQHFQHLLPEDQRTAFHRLGLGAVAVAVFFAISGFVVAEANAVFYPRRPGAFLANRLLRVVPPYFAALALSVLVHTALWQAGRLSLWDYHLAGIPLRPSVLLGGVLGLVPGMNTGRLAEDFEFIPFVWTLRVEMAFYLAAAALLWAAPRLAPWAVAATLAASAIFLTHGQPGLLSTVPMFLVGVAWWARPHRGWLACLAVSVVLAGIGFASWRQHFFPVLPVQLALTLGLATLAAGLSRHAMPPAWRAWDRRLGDLSYPLYLNHYALGILLSSLTSARGWPIYAAGMVASVGLAWVMGQGVDRRLQAWRTRIRGASVAGQGG